MKIPPFLFGAIYGLIPASLAAADPFIEKVDLFTVGEDPAFKIYHIPGIVVTAKGTVLAWCEARRDGSDWDDIKILLRRSTDEGKTWSSPASIVDVPGPKQKNAFEPPLSPDLRWGGCNRSEAQMDGAQ